MPRKATTMALSLTEEARSTLAALARSRTAAAHHVERSAIILHLADRRDASEIAATLGIDRQRVTRCARRVTLVPKWSYGMCREPQPLALVPLSLKRES